MPSLVVGVLGSTRLATTTAMQHTLDGMTVSIGLTILITAL